MASLEGTEDALVQLSEVTAGPCSARWSPSTGTSYKPFRKAAHRALYGSGPQVPLRSRISYGYWLDEVVGEAQILRVQSEEQVMIPVPGQGLRHTQPPREPTCPWCGYTGCFQLTEEPPPCHPAGDYAVCDACGYTDVRAAFGGEMRGALQESGDAGK
jgi:hypothetical protein